LPWRRRPNRLWAGALLAAVLILAVLTARNMMRDPADGFWAPPSVPVADWTADRQLVTFYLHDYSLLPYVRVVVNGEVKGAFSSRYVTVAVQEGDSLALDGTFYNRPVKVEVLDVSGGVKSPRRGDLIQINGGLVKLGQVAVGSRPR